MQNGATFGEFLELIIYGWKRQYFSEFEVLVTSCLEDEYFVNKPPEDSLLAIYCLQFG